MTRDREDWLFGLKIPEVRPPCDACGQVMDAPIGSGEIQALYGATPSRVRFLASLSYCLIMATDDRSYPSRGYSGLRQEIGRYNAALDARLQHRWGISVKLWKVLRATTDLVAVMLAGYAMWLGADPGVALLVIAAVVVGVEAVEAIVAQGEDGGTN